MKLSTRDLATLAVFGALWGMVEVSLGSVLKTLDIPMSGMVLAAIGLTIALVGRIFVPQRGSTLFIGVIAMLMKLFSLGGVIVGPMIGILTEAIVAETVLSAAGRPSRPVFTLTGALGVGWVMLQPFVTGPLLFGRTLITTWLDFIDKAGRILGIDPSAIVWIVLAYLSIHLVVGGLAGWFSWDIARLLQMRLGRSSITTNPL